MAWFNDMKIRYKLLLVFGIVLCVAVFFAVFAVTRTSQIGVNLGELIDSYQARQIHISDAVADVYKIRLSTFAMLQQYENEEIDFTGITREYDGAVDSFRNNLGDYKNLVANDKWLDDETAGDSLLRANQIIEMFDDYIEQTKHLYDERTVLDSVQIRDLLLQSREVGDELTLALNNNAENEKGLYYLIVEAVQNQAGRILTSVDRTNTVLLFLSAAFILLAFLILLFTISNIIRPISLLEEAVSKIADGDLSYPLNSARKDELGELSNHISHMVGEIVKHGKIAAAAKMESDAKSTFLANMSHEIRTPMNAILGIAEMQLYNDSLQPEITSAFSKIHNAGDLLLSIINDILDLSKIEAGKMELSLQKYDVASLINDTVILNMMRIGSKPIVFELFVDETIPSVLIGDDLRIKQVLNNLLSNAFKYTAKGTVKLRIGAEPGGGSFEALLIEVSDTGQGMSDAQIADLFKEYTRFNDQANRTAEGTGLGMSITWSLLNMMGGSISVESEIDKGSVFTVRLPQEVSDPAIIGKELAQNLQNFKLDDVKKIRKSQVTYEPMPYGRILIVDDVDSNLYVARGLMAPFGLSISTAVSGFEAIALIEKNYTFDIIFMDHMMPKMDGIETTKRIRELGYEHPIIALTANAVVGQADLFLSNGFDDFISKPIDMRQLASILKKYVRDKQPIEVLENVRQLMSIHKKWKSTKESGLTVEQKLAEYFVKDAEKVIAVLEETQNMNGAFDEETIKKYVTNVHAIKSALSNVGETALAATAAKLEQAGREGNTAIMVLETSLFLTNLRAVVSKFDLPETPYEYSEPADDDMQLLQDKAVILIAACETYDKKTVKAVLGELKQGTWSKPVRDSLDEMSECLISSDFDQIAIIAGRLAF